MAVDGEYQHSPLPKADHIRILDVHPGRPKDEIQSSIEIRRLEPSTGYTALSYSWGMNADGDASFCRTMRIDGKLKAITQNLYECLLRIRDHQGHRKMWIDAVCIDQSNIPERNQQVAQMAEVYKHASKVIVWLGEGPSEEEDRLVLQLFQWTESHVSTADLEGQEARQTLPEPVRLALFWPLMTDSERRKPRDQLIEGSALFEGIIRAATAFAGFLTRRYFSRRWTCQELWHPSAAAIEILWGPCSYSGLKFQQEHLDHDGQQVNRMSHILLQASHAFELRGSGKEEYESMHVTAVKHMFYLILVVVALEPDLSYESLANTGYTGTVSTHFTKLLHRLPRQYCSDDRDILFALLGLAPDFEFAPDYNLSTVEVYTGFTGILVEKGLFDLILYNLGTPREGLLQDVSPLSGLPSWVPDLRCRIIQDDWAVYDRLEAVIHEDNVLSCHLYLVGSGEQGPSHDEFIASLNRVIGLQLSDTMYSYGYCLGDIVCSTHGNRDSATFWNNPGHLLILRPSIHASGRYRILQVVRDLIRSEPALALRSQKVEVYIE